MRRALATTVLVLAVGAMPALAAASSASNNPTKAQIAKAIKAAENSKSLWATVNICNTTKYPGSVGIRGQMPSLGFPAWLSMRIELGSWDPGGKKFVPDASAIKLVRLGRSSRGLQQGGQIFGFGHLHKSTLFDASVTFIWRRSGQLLGQKTLATTGNHPGADFGSPPHYSAASCRIP